FWTLLRFVLPSSPMLRSGSRSTVFPYTTLFRSLESALRALYESERALRARGVAGRGETGVARERYALILEGEERWNRFAAMLAEDRKSTRLNSSHVKNSYAVFCLKKKNSGVTTK